MEQLPWAIVAINTTGIRPLHDKIIEIAIVRYQEGQVVERFHHFIDPEMALPQYKSALSAIDQERLRQAPKFYQLAKAILQRLEKCVFVAHNARFAVGFIKNAFESLGYVWRPYKTLCALKMTAYCLDHFKHDPLVKQFTPLALPQEEFAGAQDKAEHILLLLQKMQALLLPAQFKQALLALNKTASLPPHLNMDLNKIPQVPGVYLFYAQDDLPIYIGKSKSLRGRILSHFQDDRKNNKEMKISQQIRRIDWIETAGELSALLSEAQLIKHYQPLFNRRLRRHKKLYSLTLDKNRPYHKVAIVNQVDPVQLENYYGLFVCQHKAQQALEAVSRKNEVCLHQVGCTFSAPCFMKQLNKCHGICATTEYDARAHNAHLAKALQSLRCHAWPFEGAIAIVEQSPQGKKQYILAHHWYFLGVVDSLKKVKQASLNLPKWGFDKDVYMLLSQCIVGQSHPVIELKNNIALESVSQA